VRSGGLPDDEGERPAGLLIFDLENQMVSMGFDLVDVENTDDEPGGVDFFLGLALQGSFEFKDLMDTGSPVFDPTIEFGNNTANRISAVLLAELDNAVGPVFDRMVFRMGGSGAIDNVVLATAPEPAALPLLLIAGALLGCRLRARPEARRRRVGSA